MKLNLNRCYNIQSHNIHIQSKSVHTLLFYRLKPNKKFFPSEYFEIHPTIKKNLEGQITHCSNKRKEPNPFTV